jgi:GxxExxY protein
MKIEDTISKIIVDSAIEVHRTLGGPGLLESVYEESLAKELEIRGVHIQRQVSLPIYYKNLSLPIPCELICLPINWLLLSVQRQLNTIQSMSHRY